MQVTTKLYRMQFVLPNDLENLLYPVRPLVIDNHIMMYNMDTFATSVLNMWTAIGKFAGNIFCQFVTLTEQIIAFLYESGFNMDIFGFIFLILFTYVALDSLMTDYENKRAENKNRMIEIDDMRAKIDFYEAKHQSYDLLVGELYNNMNKLKRTIRKLEREMKKYD